MGGDFAIRENGNDIAARIRLVLGHAILPLL
jgi:hypothetical protein